MAAPISVTPNTARKTKTIFQLESPFRIAQWPHMSSQIQDTILELLCSLLSPVGKYRANHVTASKGKRYKKRKRQEAKLKKEEGVSTRSTDSAPPLPEISHHIAIGLSSVTRILESSSRKSNPHKTSSPQSEPAVSMKISSEASTEVPLEPGKKSITTIEEATTNRVLATIFVSQRSQLGILHAHLPQLTATASLAYPGSPPTRLIQLPKGSEERLCEALGLPRVSCIAIFEDAPLCTTLINLVRESVAPIGMAWLKEGKTATYLPVKVNSIQAFVPIPKKPLNTVD